MKSKEIQVGEEYILVDSKKSRVGCSKKYFEQLINKKVTVIKNLKNFNNINTVQIHGAIDTEEGYDLVAFWCSPYDLGKIGDKYET